MMKLKPTMREVRVVLNSLNLGYETTGEHYNDKRVMGGRIKFYSNDNIHPWHMIDMEDKLKGLFPGDVFKVEKYKGKSYTVKWRDADWGFEG
jgi:hypothetical protein